MNDPVIVGNSWATTVGLLAIALTSLVSLLAQALAMWKASQVAAQAKEDAAKAQESADKAAAEAKKATAAVAVAAEAAAREVRKVGVALAETTIATTGKLDELADVASKTHLLVNSAHGKALEAVATLSRWKAEQPGATVEDTHAALAAESALAAHRGKQQTVDSGGGG